jgi:hypothetical protein
MSTASYAWFSINNKVQVTGMEVKTKVSSNLLIAKWDDGHATKGNAETLYLSKIDQTSKGILEPVSTVDAVNFWYTSTSNVVADGRVNSTAYIKYGSEAALTGSDATKYDHPFSLNYGIDKDLAPTLVAGQTGAKAYVDYVFFLKATNTETSDAVVAMTKCNLLFNGEALSSSATVGSSSVNSLAGKAWRVAMLTQESAQATGTTGDGALKTILTLAGAANFTDGQAVNAADGVGSVTYNTPATVDNALASGVTKYYKVVIRMWLEGEDNTCNNDTYALLNQAYTLDLEFSIGPSTSVAGVANISSEAPVAP